MKELKQKSHLFVKILQGNSNADLSVALVAALTRNKSTIETLLGGELVYDENCISGRSTDAWYAQDAVSVKPKEVSDRGKVFSLVLGPSGSGKTFFALYGLPELVFEAPQTEILVVHFQSDQAVDRWKRRGLGKFPAAVASMVEERIKTRLAEKMKTLAVYVDEGNNEDVQLGLHVIIDEAGGDEYQAFVGTAAGIENIVAALKEEMEYKFKKKVHVSIVGTGLETTTSSIRSLVDCTKFRMQPWTLHNFDAMVNASRHHAEKKQLVKDVVHEFPILESLISNARCAFYLLKCMTESIFLRKNRVKQFVKSCYF
jgi:hypothetical protein